MPQSQKYQKSLTFKWNEGKFCDLKAIEPFIPEYSRYIELFIGNGQFFLLQNPTSSALLNDTDRGLINFYKSLGKKTFGTELKWIAQSWEQLDRFYSLINSEIFMVLEDFYDGIISKPDLPYVIRVIVLMNTNNPAFNKLFATKNIIDFDKFTSHLIKNILDRLQKIKISSGKERKLSLEEIDNLMHTTVKCSFYSHLLEILNNPSQYPISAEKQAAFWFLTRELSHGNEFRPDQGGLYQAAYGGSAYNNKDLYEKIFTLTSESFIYHFKNCQFYCLDFEEFLATIEPGPDDFVLVNLPLRNSLLNPNNVQFSENAYKRLTRLLTNLKSKWLLIARKNEDNTPLFKIEGTTVNPVVNEKKPTKGANFFIIKNF